MGQPTAPVFLKKTEAQKKPAILEETPKSWDRTMGVNLNGIFFPAKAQIQTMLKLPKSPRSIVNIASIASMTHGPDCYAYGASKRAVASLTTSISGDVASFGIRANTVSPCKFAVDLIVYRSQCSQISFMMLLAHAILELI
jgi:chanoclavine-I dehydrogenase